MEPNISTKEFDEPSCTYSIKQLSGSDELLLENAVPRVWCDTDSNVLLNGMKSSKNASEKNKSIVDYINEQVLANPLKIAVYFGDHELSYSDLDKKSNQIANLLISKNIDEGDIVGVAMDRSIQMIVVLLGILKAGAAYLPLDPQYPTSRIAFMLADSSCRFTVCNDKYAESLPSSISPLIVEELVKTIDSYSTLPDYKVLSGNDLAYILYTSGSTGNPKGVMIEHSSLANYLLSFRESPGLNGSDRFLAITTICFDISITEMFLPLISGASVVLVDSYTARDGEELLKVINRNSVTVIQATPTTWQMILNTGWEESLPVKGMCGGEPLSKDLAGKLIARVDELWNVYGPTETTVWSAIKKIENASDQITVGRPIANTRIYILDENRRPVQSGMPGEIFIGGDGVARGYLNRPELTNEKFIVDPFEDSENSRMYATGDLGTISETGEIVCLGRIDSQVKIRGHRIELGEIEYNLVQFAEINEAVVVPAGDSIENLTLVAYIKLDERTRNTPDLQVGSIIVNNHGCLKEWRTELKKSLPTYMIPTMFYVLESFPTTNNGKIDRKSLPKLDMVDLRFNSAESITSVDSSMTSTQQIISKIWAMHLSLTQISIDSNFFELGGNSLVALKVMTDLMKTTGIKLPLSALFEHPTVEKLALLIDGDRRNIKWNSLVPIRSSGSKPPVYLVHGLGLNVLIFERLRAYMDPEQPIYALQGSGISGDMKDFPKSIEELAKNYLTEILDRDKSESFALAGFSFGGLLAFEMARQLLAMGKKVDMLTIIDSSLHLKKHSKESLLMKPLLSPIYFCISYLLNPKTTLKHHINWIKSVLIRHKIIHRNKKVELEGYEKRLKEVYLKMFFDYNLMPLNIKINLLKCKIRVMFYNDKYFGWKRYATVGINTKLISGDHTSCFKEPNAKGLALTLQKQLNSIQSDET